LLSPAVSPKCSAVVGGLGQPLNTEKAMGLLEHDAENVQSTLQKWKPSAGLTKEAEFRDDLRTFLDAQFKGVVVHKEFAYANTKADLYVNFKQAKKGSDVIVEVKHNLTGRNEFHRLLGQIVAYKYEWTAEVLVVLCGATDPAFVKLAQQVLKGFDDSLERRFLLVTK
jgi:hypothetical protein